MAVHPTITCTITSVTSYTGTEGVSGANYQVNGDLTLLGKTNPVTSPAKIDLSNNRLAAEATLKADRTKWGITYASGSALSDANFIMTNMDIHLKLVGSKD